MRANGAKASEKIYEFWKEVKVINNSKMPVPSSIEGTTGSENNAELWEGTIKNVFNCVKSDVFTIGEVTHNEGMAITYEEVETLHR